MTKRKCKNIDITNIEFIEFCIADWFDHKSTKDKNKQSIRKLFIRFPDFHSLALYLSDSIKTESLCLPPVHIRHIIDKANGKHRDLVLESPIQQIYNYICYHALEEVTCCIGHYQIHSDGRGPIDAVRYIQSWMNEPSTNYCIKADISKCYDSISRENMMWWLNKHIKNNKLLWLINELLLTKPNGGLGIGSRLSIRLSALYLSDIYHCVEDLHRFSKRVTAYITHQLFYLDDIFIFGPSSKYLIKMFALIRRFVDASQLRIKDNWAIIDLRHCNKNACLDVLGYKVYRDHIVIRRRNYKKTKKSLNKFKETPTLSHAQSYVAYYGQYIQHSDHMRFQQKYNSCYYWKKARKEISKCTRQQNLLISSQPYLLPKQMAILGTQFA